MEQTLVIVAAALAAGGYLGRRIQVRLRLSRAKHPSLQGHSRMARRVARLVPFYTYSERRFFACDDAPAEIAQQREAGFRRLARTLREQSPASIEATQALKPSISDLQFTSAYRVPFQFRPHVERHLPLGGVARASEGVCIEDLDGNWRHDLSGSYGVNVFGYDFYKRCLDEAWPMARSLGPVLGAYHPVVADNVARIRAISGQEEVSFHMSGTEAVMQAVRLARYHTRRPQLVRLCGAYHGWWDGVQPGIGNQRRADDVYTLKEMDAATLHVLRTRRDIACVLVSPFQALHPNAGAPSDATLVNSSRHCAFDAEAYREWLEQLRAVCSERGIVLILDEVFSGFRLAWGGAQEYFGVRADMVTYGKTLGGGLPVGVLCGPHRLMKRYRDARPTDICFARGTFNAHPCVMTAMQAFLRRTEDPAIRAGYPAMRATWDERARRLNAALEQAELPLRIVNLVSIWSVIYTTPSRYNWMFQFYLNAEGILLSWTGTGRLIFSHDYGEADFQAVMDKFLAAAHAMQADGWWWQGPALTDRWISRRILRELLLTRLRRGERARAQLGTTPRGSAGRRARGGPDHSDGLPGQV